ncbi:MAG: hypothetical protein HY791_33960 [Deltaproteobacteria bacterium]|nr:hypothetical protein [Deltaproteobacteria bacterium]
MRVRLGRIAVRTSVLLMACTSPPSVVAQADAAPELPPDAALSDALILEPDAITADAAVELADAGRAGGLCTGCNEGEECASGVCLRFANGERFCGRACSRANPCPGGYRCLAVDGLAEAQCAPSAGTCRGQDAGEDAAIPDSEPRDATPQSEDAGLSCDPEFMGPFCSGDVILGFDDTAADPAATDEEVRAYALAALNHLRSRTCLPPLSRDACLDGIGASAIATVESLGVHGYFVQNCLDGAHGFGRSCECGWAQENYGAASGSRFSWKYGVRGPLCSMMTEPRGQGHRGNIESTEWTKLGVGLARTPNGMAWYHEFGR